MQNLKIALVAVFCLCGCLTSPAHADARSTALASRFVSLCTKSLPDFDRIDKVAALMKLIEQDELAPISSAGESVRAKNWKGVDSGGDYRLAVSEKISRMRQLTSCEISSRDADASVIRREIIARLKLGKPLRESIPQSGFPITTAWKLAIGADKVLVVLTQAFPESRGIKLSVQREIPEADLLASLFEEPVDQCPLRIYQGGQEILPTVTGLLKTFKLVADSFKLEVSSADCHPAMTLVDKHELDFITQTPLIFSRRDVFGAGNTETGATLSYNVRDRPYVTLGALLGLARDAEAAKLAYEALCDNLTYCPAPVMAYASAWPFLGADRMFRGYAEFKWFGRVASPISKISGKVLLAVVYTRWRESPEEHAWGHNEFQILKPNPIALDFSVSDPGLVPLN